MSCTWYLTTIAASDILKLHGFLVDFEILLAVHSWYYPAILISVKKKKMKDKKKRWIERISACSYLYIDCGLTYVSQSRCAITKKKKEQVRNIA